jgi:hypothetical protein
MRWVEGRIGEEQRGMYIYEPNTPLHLVTLPGISSSAKSVHDCHIHHPELQIVDAGPRETSLIRQALGQIPGTLPRSANLAVVLDIQLAEKLYSSSNGKSRYEGVHQWIWSCLLRVQVSYMKDGALYRWTGCLDELMWTSEHVKGIPMLRTSPKLKE